MLDERELIYVYVAISKHAVSLVLLREANREHPPIYFVRKTFMNYQTKYLSLEKLFLAMVLNSRKLIHYFQAHPIDVYIEFLLKNILSKADLFGQLSKWAIELIQ